MTSPDPLPALVAPFRDDPDGAAVLTDFDGTLAPIIDDPAAARALPGAVKLLHDLARRFATVAVVSGRPAEFLVDRLELRTGARLQAFGLYGLEWVEDGRVVQHHDGVRWTGAVEAVAKAADATAPDDVLVERKGMSMTLHVRTAPERNDWARSFAEAQSSATGLALHQGRMSYELRPPIDVDKGSVVTQLTDGARAACFIGDDVGDLAAFDALDRLTAASGAAVLRVAVRSDEAPPELIERADILVDGPPGVLDLLRNL